jgi:lysozyme family protein
MTTRFLKAMPYIFQHEGGYSLTTGDSGKNTNFGISLTFLHGLSLAEGDINHDGKIDYIDIQKLDKEHAEELYYNNFWKPYYETMPERIAIKMFDTGVNGGTSRSVKLLQTALNTLGSHIPVDGLIGKTTLAEVTKYNESILLTQYCKSQTAFYDDIVAAKPDQSKFINGWHNRANFIPA